MCKVASVTNINDANREAVWSFMQVLGEQMTPGNKDGLGYAAFDKEGNLFGERWLINKHAFIDLSKYYPKLTAKIMNKVYSYFGKQVRRQEAQAIILHTRAATCGKGIENTHPFVDNEENPNAAIIHNGMISNHASYTKKYGTCDSEVIAHMYHEEGVVNNFNNMQVLFDKLKGWMTVAILAKTKENRLVMDFFTDGRRLSSYYIPQLGTRVYSTSGFDITEVAAFFGYEVKDGKSFKEYTAQRIDVLTGEVIESKEFEGPKYVPHARTHVSTLDQLFLRWGVGSNRFDH